MTTQNANTPQVPAGVDSSPSPCSADPRFSAYQKSLAEYNAQKSDNVICDYCEKPIEPGQPSVSDGDARMHLGCSVEDAENVGFDGWIQDQG